MDLTCPEQGMELTGDPPLKQYQDFGIQKPWSPPTPLKNISTRRQMVSSPSYSQMNQACTPIWLDPMPEIHPSTPPWDLSFANGICRMAGIPIHLQDLIGSQPLPEASANQAAINSFIPLSASDRSLNLDANVLSSNNVIGDHKMSPLSFCPGRNGYCQMMPASSNQLLFDGKCLLPQIYCNCHGNWADMKAQYGLLNSFPESAMSFAGTGAVPSLLSHNNIEKYSQKILDEQQSLDVNGLVNEKKENFLIKGVLAEASFSNLIASSENSCYQNPDCYRDLDAVPSGQISFQLTGIEKSLVERENEIIDLNDASKQKLKRKKHRPKVIIEGKPVRTPTPKTPKPKTPKPARGNETASGKRKYVRRKKEMPPNFDTNALEGVVEAESLNGVKSVRRSLNFDFAESHSEENFSFLSMFMQNQYSHEQKVNDDCKSASSKLKEMADSSAAQGPIVENSLTGIVFDLRSSACEPLNEYLKILQSPLPSSSISQSVGASNSIAYSDNVSDPPPKGTKRDRCLTDEAWGLATNNLMPCYNARDFVCQSCNVDKNGSCLVDINKRMRMEKDCNESICNPSKSAYIPETGWKIMQASNNAQEFTSTSTMKFMAQAQLKTLQHVLLREEEADMNKHGSHLLSNKLISLNGFTDIANNSTPVKLSCQKNNAVNQPPTPDKPFGYSNSQESKNCGTLVQFEASEDVNKPVKAKGRRARKKGEKNSPVKSSPSLSSSAFHGQINPMITTKSYKKLKGKNLHPESILSKSQDTNNYKDSTKSSIPSLSLHMYGVDYIVHKLRQLSISGDHEGVSSQAQNAIIPYVGHGGTMVPYNGSFELVKRRRPRAKVDLDPETDRVWKLLMGIECNGNEGTSMDKEIWWEEERKVFRGRVDSFIARMHLVQGDRRFSQWKGSVVDSVIGVFLTQNVSDHLSSSAFMALAAKFPLRSGDNFRDSNANKANTESENQIECITSLSDAPNLQSNSLDHGLCCQASLEINATKSRDNKENSSSNDSFGSSSVSSSAVYRAGKILESHETELSSDQESPDSGSNTVVTVARSINSMEIEGRRLVEEVVSLQASAVSSKNTLGCQVPSNDHIRSSLMMTTEADDLASASIINGIGPSFTELLHIAESNKFQELYCHGSMPNANGHVICSTGNSLPVLDHINNSKGACQHYQANLISHHTLFGLPNMLPQSQLLYSLDPSNFTTLENNANTLKEDKRCLLNSTTGEIVLGNKFEDNHGVCSGLPAENIAESNNLNKILFPSGTASAIDSYVSIRIPSREQSMFSETEVDFNRQSFNNKNRGENIDASSNLDNFYECSTIQAENMERLQQKEEHSTLKAEISQEAIIILSQMDNNTSLKTSSASNITVQEKLDVEQTVGLSLKDEAYNHQKVSSEASKQGKKVRKKRVDGEKKTFDWDTLRKKVNCNKSAGERSSSTMDSLDWEAVRCADVSEIAETIRERGMNNMLAERIKDFLNRLVREHGSIDLEWLRDVPPDKSKDYLLSIRGLGLKSAECVRLLTLHHLAFPVDTNVGRICVRLGWVPLQPLPESLQLHLLELYPVLETIQKYLWPRLCKLDQRTLYELHYQMITFGKVFCTKSKPNCNACPMRGECRHFASAFASARLALPASDDKSIVSSTNQIATEHEMAPSFTPSSIPQLECGTKSQEPTTRKNCEPIIEEPATPEPECPKTLESEIEDAFFEDPDEIPTIKLNFEKFTQNLQNYMQENMELQAADMSKALVALTPEAASIPMPKLKNISRLRTEHQVYEIPDTHPLLEGLEQREPDDPCPYLLAIWTPGETAQSTEPPIACCNSQDTGQLCDNTACFACNSIRESESHKVRGTLLIPCRTAMRGSFPLNGTYFQVNEVFADHHTSRNPIDIPRDWIWNLPRRTVCFGTSIPTIFRGLTTEGIQHCFWRGFVCVRGFDRVTRAPKPLYARLHFPASKAPKNRKGGVAAGSNQSANTTSELTGFQQ